MDYDNALESFFKDLEVSDSDHYFLELGDNQHYLVEDWIKNKQWIELFDHFVVSTFSRDLYHFIAGSILNITSVLGSIYRKHSVNYPLEDMFKQHFLNWVNQDDIDSCVVMQACLLGLANTEELSCIETRDKD